jgi:hypothetical protein
MTGSFREGHFGDRRQRKNFFLLRPMSLERGQRLFFSSRDCLACRLQLNEKTREQRRITPKQGKLSPPRADPFVAPTLPAPPKAHPPWALGACLSPPNLRVSHASDPSLPREGSLYCLILMTALGAGKFVLARHGVLRTRPPFTARPINGLVGRLPGLRDNTQPRPGCYFWDDQPSVAALNATDKVPNAQTLWN